MVLGVLIVFKSDKQSVHMLEGKLHRRGKTIAAAKVAYKRHSRTIAVMLSALGMGALALGVILWVNDDRTLAVASGIAAALLCALGLRSRVHTFVAVDEELS